ncbi:MAG: nucleotidyltransferase domain-containing protein [Actinomycetota bacterium]
MTDPPTPLSAAVATYADAVANAVNEVFGRRRRGVWLVGSHAYGGATPLSDIDIQAAVHEPKPDEVADLADRIAHPHLRCPGVGIEFVLYDEAILADPIPPLRWALNLNGGPTRAHSRSTDHRTESWHWFILDLAIGRQFARTLTGRDLADVLGPIGDDVVVAAIAQSLRWHDAHEAGGPNQVANAARGLRFLRTGRWGSKPEGLSWAEGEGLAQHTVMAELARALEARGERGRGRGRGRG